jgi:hypothetical protein
MKLLLDDNLPKRFKQDYPEYEIFTVRDQNWSGYKNGDLIRLMLENGFDALITFDKNLQYQQNFTKYPVHVLVLNSVSNRYVHLRILADRIKMALSVPKIGVTIIE